MTRIQRQRTKGWRMPAGAVYVGRPSRWGNAFSDRRGWVAAGSVGLEVEPGVWSYFRLEDLRGQLYAYRIWVLSVLRRNPAFLAPLRDAKALACWCPLDKPCHADVLSDLLAPLQ